MVWKEKIRLNIYIGCLKKGRDMNRVLFLILMLLVSSSVRAEIFQGILPYSTLGEIKELFPKASFSKVNAAWVTEDQGFYKMEGSGFSGILFLAFTDYRPLFRGLVQFEVTQLNNLEKLEKTEDNDAKINKSKAGIEEFQKVVNHADDVALTIIWYRWVPVSPIPLQRYISKYGKPEKSGFRDDNMQPYRKWSKRGVTLTLSDDETKVLTTEFVFTAEEMRTYCKMKGRANCK
jgi:hypothetical protein